MNKIPYKVKQMAIDDSCKAHLRAIQKYKKTKTTSNIRFRSKKSPNQNFYIQKEAIHENGIYKRFLDDFRITEKFNKGDIHHDCRLVKQDGRYYMIIPFEKTTQLPDNQRNRLVSLDPGVRRFVTFYSPEKTGYFAQGDFNRIYRLCLSLDKIISKRAKSSGLKKIKYTKTASRIRWKIKDLLSELHHKTALFLCKNYENIIFPTYNAMSMAIKVNSKVARSLLNWSHGRFKLILQDKCKEYRCNFIQISEAYTSKTCSLCGNIQPIYGKKSWTCNQCHVTLDRDINGARGIFLRALVEQPILKSDFQDTSPDCLFKES